MGSGAPIAASAITSAFGAVSMFQNDAGAADGAGARRAAAEAAKSASRRKRREKNMSAVFFLFPDCFNFRCVGFEKNVLSFFFFSFFFLLFLLSPSSH